MLGRKKGLIAVTAISLAATLAVGTFAWTNFSAQAVNEWTGTGTNTSGATLHDDEWPDGRRSVYVENWGGAEVFVRVRLDEYMEVGEGAGLKSESTDSDGNPVHNPQNYAEPLQPGTNIDQYDTWRHHLPTINDLELDPNDIDSPFYPYWRWEMGGDVYQFWPASADLRVNKEYVDKTTSTTETNPEAMQWTPASGILSMQQWIDEGRPISDYWVVDSADGWAYWASPIPPGGASGLLLASVSRTADEPEGDYYYGVHVIAQMATKEGSFINDSEDNYRRFGDAENTGWSSDGAALMENIVNRSYDLITYDGSDERLQSVPGGFEYTMGSATATINLSASESVTWEVPSYISGVTLTKVNDRTLRVRIVTTVPIPTSFTIRAILPDGKTDTKSFTITRLLS
ncbi:MAG: hypothetical protein LBT44_00460 [Clostridiales bacterium]|jgi:hypothetical protein|nr:hypothetical protein [Clostridiales bacterium]